MMTFYPDIREKSPYGRFNSHYMFIKYIQSKIRANKSFKFNYYIKQSAA